MPDQSPPVKIQDDRYLVRDCAMLASLYGTPPEASLKKESTTSMRITGP